MLAMTQTIHSVICDQRLCLVFHPSQFSMYLLCSNQCMLIHAAETHAASLTTTRESCVSSSWKAPKLISLAVVYCFLRRGLRSHAHGVAVTWGHNTIWVASFTLNQHILIPQVLHYHARFDASFAICSMCWASGFTLKTRCTRRYTCRAQVACVGFELVWSCLLLVQSTQYAHV